MPRQALPSSERSRPWTGSTATVVAVLLMLAILPSAATVSSPMSAAILEASLREARLIQVQRERPDPSRPNVGAVESWRATQAKQAVGVGAVSAQGPVLAAQAVGVEFKSDGHARGAVTLGALVRAGFVALPPPARA